MSESPASWMERTQTLWSLEAAVPINGKRKRLDSACQLRRFLLCKLLTELNVVSLEMENLRAAEDGHVLELGLADGRAVVRDDDKLGLAVSQALHGGLETY